MWRCQSPGPENKKSNIAFCYWNLNDLMAHNFIKVSLLQTLSVTNDYDIICFTETFLDSSVENDGDRISIPGYNLLHADHPGKTKRGGVCIYYKDHLCIVSYMNVWSLSWKLEKIFLTIIKRNDLCQLHKCLVVELRIGKKKCFLTCF